MGARPHLRQRIVAARSAPHMWVPPPHRTCDPVRQGPLEWHMLRGIGSRAVGSRPDDSRGRRTGGAGRCGAPAPVPAPGGCRPGCAPRRGRCAGRRARAHRCRTPRTGSGRCGRRRSRGWLGAAVEQHAVADLAGGGDAVGRLVGVGRLQRSTSRPAACAPAAVSPLSVPVLDEVGRGASGRGAGAVQQRDERAAVDERRAPAPAMAANVGARSMLPTSRSTCAPAGTPGPRTMSGTWMSVSYAVCLPAGRRCWPRWKPLSDANTM